MENKDKKEELKVPRCMSTQHPDNANVPSFCDKDVIEGTDEVEEADFAYAELKCDEQMWDAEGKEAYSSVIRSLLEKNQEFFKNNKLGRDLRLTIRVPNPKHEKVEMKAILESLENITRSYDTAKKFYESLGVEYDKAPIFEIILPMTTSTEELERIFSYYKENIGNRDHWKAYDMKVKDWIGETKPKQINVIPLIEDKIHMLKSDEIVRDFVKDKNLEYQRVFLARSDPALNYGLIPAVLINKIALKRLHELEKETGVKIYPILGVGSAPFRGNFRPETVRNSLNEFPSVQTFTLQSAFKYDNPKEEVKEATNYIESKGRGEPRKVDEERCLEVIEKLSENYREKIEKLADKINEISKYVPSRRSRKLHVGLFGYSRELDGSGKGVKLPRAIKFTASLYSLGIPPEIIGISSLSEEDFEFLKETYPKLEIDIKHSLKYMNEHALNKFEFLKDDFETAKNRFEFSPDKKHEECTSNVLNSDYGVEIKNEVVRASKIRKFLG